MQEKLAELKIKSDGAPDSPVGREAKKVQDYYTQYNVYNIPGWDNNYGEEVELTDFERAGSPPKKRIHHKRLCHSIWQVDYCVLLFICCDI